MLVVPVNEPVLAVVSVKLLALPPAWVNAP